MPSENGFDDILLHLIAWVEYLVLSCIVFTVGMQSNFAMSLSQIARPQKLGISQPTASTGITTSLGNDVFLRLLAQICNL